MLAKGNSNAPPLTVVSIPTSATQSASHSGQGRASLNSGLVFYLGVPSTRGQATASSFTDPDYDAAALRAQVRALFASGRVSSVRYGDPSLFSGVLVPGAYEVAAELEGEVEVHMLPPDPCHACSAEPSARPSWVSISLEEQLCKDRKGAWWRDGNRCIETAFFPSSLRPVAVRVDLSAPVTFFLRSSTERIRPCADVDPNNPDCCVLQQSTLERTRFPAASCKLDLGQPTYVLVHGYRSTGTAPWILDIADRLLELHPSANVVLVDWEEAASVGGLRSLYRQAAVNVRAVGAILANLLLASGVNLDATYLMGHSLGAHVCGEAGLIVREDFNREPIARIFGFDPAGELQAPGSASVPLLRLSPQSAATVVTILTDTDVLGVNAMLGHVNFLPDGGEDQACSGPFCDHSVAHQVFLSALTNPTPCRGFACPRHTSSGGPGRLLPSLERCWCRDLRNCPMLGLNVATAEDSEDNKALYFRIGTSHPFCQAEAECSDVSAPVARSSERVFLLSGNSLPRVSIEPHEPTKSKWRQGACVDRGAYSLPSNLRVSESSPLLDAKGHLEVQASEHFSVFELLENDVGASPRDSDIVSFKNPFTNRVEQRARFFRYDLQTLQCLQHTRQSLGAAISVASWYKVKNSAGNTRFGQAQRKGRGVQLNANGWENGQRLLVQAVMRGCVQRLQQRHLKVTIGLSREHVFVELQHHDGITPPYSSWTTEDAAMSSKDFAAFVNGLGPHHMQVLASLDSCKASSLSLRLSRQNGGYRHPARESYRTRGPDCENSVEYSRTKSLVERSKQMRPGVDVDWLDLALRSCVAGCTASGTLTPDGREAACDEFLHWMPLDLHHSQGHYHLAALTDHSARSMACQYGNCLEKTPAFQVVALHREAAETIEFPSLHQESPLPRLVHHTFGMHAEGVVTLWVSSEEYLSAMHDILQVLTLYNHRVTFVEVRVPPTVVASAADRCHTYSRAFQVLSCADLQPRATLAPHVVLPFEFPTGKDSWWAR